MEAPVLVSERERYPLHEEDDMPEAPSHFLQANYLVSALRSRQAPQSVQGNFALYWERGDSDKYVGPDLVVLSEPLPDWREARVWLAWQDPPVILVGEIASRWTRSNDRGSKIGVYETVLKVPEYLFVDVERHELWLRRLIDGRYAKIVPDEDGRVWSAQLQCWFGWNEDGFVNVFERTGERIVSHEEALFALEAERLRSAELERRLSELMARTQPDAGSSS